MERLPIYITNSLKIIQFLRSYIYLYNINKILLLLKYANPFSVICSPANQKKLTQVLGSKYLGFYVFKTLICIVCKPWLK